MPMLIATRRATEATAEAMLNKNELVLNDSVSKLFESNTYAPLHLLPDEPSPKISASFMYCALTSG
jgi:hypothetical protein